MSTDINWVINPDGTKGETWNPTSGCAKVSDGCLNCYAERIHDGFVRRGLVKEPFAQIVCHWDRLRKPLSWKKPRMIFVNSMSDLFHPDVEWNFIFKVFEMMLNAPQHTFVVLTKRAENMRWVMQDVLLHLGRNYSNIKVIPNLWLGVSIENQENLFRLHHLLRIAAAKHIVSFEPLLSEIVVPPELLKKISWVIVGGESGHNARPCHPDWVKSLRDQCAGTKFFFKQWGEYGAQSQTFKGEPVFRCFDSFGQWVDKASGWMGKGDTCVDMTGKVLKNGGDMMKAQFPVAILRKIGKEEAGNILDGRTWLQIPDRSISQ